MRLDVVAVVDPPSKSPTPLLVAAVLRLAAHPLDQAPLMDLRLVAVAPTQVRLDQALKEALLQALNKALSKVLVQAPNLVVRDFNKVASRVPAPVVQQALNKPSELTQLSILQLLQGTPTL